MPTYALRGLDADLIARAKPRARRRIFRDAPPWARCSAAVHLRDGSWAQCGRWRNEGFARNPAGRALCTQHMKMYCDGPGVHWFAPGYPLRGWNIT